MKKVGILIEVKDGKVKPASLGVIAATLSSPVERIALLLDGRAGEIAEVLKEYGIQRVIDIATANGPIPWNADLWAQALVQALGHHNIRTLLGLASLQGKAILPRVAAYLQSPLVMDCVEVRPADHMAVKSQFSGKTVARFRTHGEYHLYGMRPNALNPVTTAGPALVETFQAVLNDNGMRVLEVQHHASGRVDLTEADVIISGGRGMGNGDNFDVLYECARQISAAVGASRVAVDNRWVSHAMQVGQTGKTVCPKVYIACGISGSVQHFAGMKTSGIIIAINKDPKAAIMGKCDYAICADLFEVIPALTRKLAAAKE